MKIVIAPDKFKGSLTGIEFCNIVEEGIKSVIPSIEILKLPLADGGDGVIEVLYHHLKSEYIAVKVNDPLFREIKASYLFVESTRTAIIETAKASGMELLSLEEQNCMNTTTYGIGEMIRDAIGKGAKNILLGLGGSATNDCGIGMAAALGYKFFDKNNKEIVPIGKNLCEIKTIDTSNINTVLKEITFNVACDVANPLTGKNGAAFVYAPQKGASFEETAKLNEGLKHISKLFLKQFDIDVQRIKGSGAAGGLGAGSLIFLNANLLPGIDLVKDLVNFNEQIMEANWIITGEGKMDSQTLSGKTIQGVMTSAKHQNIPLAVFCGSISLQKKSLDALGVSFAASIMNLATDLEDAMLNRSKYLSEIAVKFAKSIRNPDVS